MICWHYLYNLCRTTNNCRTMYIKGFVNNSIRTDLTVIGNIYFSKQFCSWTNPEIITYMWGNLHYFPYHPHFDLY